MKNTMVVYHDTLMSGLSVGAVVASMNNSMTNYLSVASLHSNPQQELNDNMCPAISKALRKYHELNKEFPARIIVYRCVLDLFVDGMMFLFDYWNLRKVLYFSPNLLFYIQGRCG